jgi:hypothetical protein
MRSIGWARRPLAELGKVRPLVAERKLRARGRVTDNTVAKLNPPHRPSARSIGLSQVARRHPTRRPTALEHHLAEPRLDLVFVISAGSNFAPSWT